MTTQVADSDLLASRAMALAAKEGHGFDLLFLNNSGEVVRKHYSPALKAWIGDLGDGKHDGGPEDPRIGIIRVKTSTAQYAVSNRTQIGGFVELAKGVASGEAP